MRQLVLCLLFLTCRDIWAQEKKIAGKFKTHLACASSLSGFDGYGMFPVASDVVLIPHTNEDEKDAKAPLPYAQGFYALTENEVYFYAFPQSVNTGTYFIELKIPGKLKPVLVSYKYKQQEPPVVASSLTKDPSAKDLYVFTEPETVAKAKVETQMRRELWKRIAQPGKTIEEKRLSVVLLEKRQLLLEGLKTCGKIANDVKLRELATVEFAKVSQILVRLQPSDLEESGDAAMTRAENQSEKDVPAPVAPTPTPAPAAARAVK